MINGEIRKYYLHTAGQYYLASNYGIYYILPLRDTVQLNKQD